MTTTTTTTTTTTNTDLPSPIDRSGIPRPIPILALPPQARPEQQQQQQQQQHNALLVLHPNYGDASNVIFSLPCVDPLPQSDSPLEFPTYDAPPSIGASAVETTALSRSYGVHHRTVLVAAQIVANNAFDGYLALDKKGTQAVLIPLEGILIGRKYFFIVPGDEFYPIVPSFQDWQFPHDKLPDSWPAVAPTEAAQAAQCVITRFPWALDRAHIVPTAQTSWFDDNGMSRYGTSVSPSIDDDCNLLWLRRDLHTPTFDAFWFALVPKPVVDTATTTATVVYSVHVLVDNQPLFPTFYHDIQLPHLRGAAREFLFARFAQAVLIRVKPFVTARKRRLIARFVVDGMKEEVIREELSGDALFKAYGGGRTRSASPTKRKRGGEEPPSSVIGQEEEWSPRIVDSDLDEDEDEDEERRGRKRRRAWEGDLGQGVACRDSGGLVETEKWPEPLPPERLSRPPDLSMSVASVDE